MSNWFDPSEIRQVGTTPDYRFSLANERTFLAWIRTGLALIAGGLAIIQFLSPLAVPHLRETLAILSIALGAGCALRAIDHWIRCEVAMRKGEPLPPSRFPGVLAVVVTVTALFALIYVIVDGVSRT